MLRFKTLQFSFPACLRTIFGIRIPQTSLFMARSESDCCTFLTHALSLRNYCAVVVKYVLNGFPAPR